MMWETGTFMPLKSREKAANLVEYGFPRTEYKNREKLHKGSEMSEGRPDAQTESSEQKEVTEHKPVVAEIWHPAMGSHWKGGGARRSHYSVCGGAQAFQTVGAQVSYTKQDDVCAEAMHTHFKSSFLCLQ